MEGTRKGVGAYLSLSLRRREVGWRWALTRGWVLIKFFCIQDGRLFEWALSQGLPLIQINMVFQLLELFTCRKLANLSWNFITETCKQHPEITRRRLCCEKLGTSPDVKGFAIGC